jgi:hypothetical protein
MSKNSTGLGAFAALKKPSPTAPAASGPGVPSPTPKASPTASGGKTAGRKITIRGLSNEDLRRLNEMKYTHGITIQEMAIEGLSLVLGKYGLKPLSGYGARTPARPEADE